MGIFSSQSVRQPKSGSVMQPSFRLTVKTKWIQTQTKMDMGVSFIINSLAGLN